LQEAAINSAIGEAQSIQRRAEATANGVKLIAAALAAPGGADAVSMHLAQQYVDAFGRIAKEGNTMIVPADASNVASMISTAVGVFRGTGGAAASGGGAGGGAGGSASGQASSDSPSDVRKRQSILSAPEAPDGDAGIHGDHPDDGARHRELGSLGSAAEGSIGSSSALERLLFPSGGSVGVANRIGFSLSK
jgi:C-terminal region of band_7